MFLSPTAELRLHPAPRSLIHAAEEAVATVGDAVSDMRYFEVRDTLPAQICQEKVRDADIYVLVAGFRYGSLVPDLQPPVSYTELEFDTATDLGMQRLVFLVAEDAIAPGAMFLDPEHGARRMAFRTKARTGTTAGTVTSPDDLKAQLIHALGQLPRPRRADAPARRIWDIPPSVEAFTGRAELLGQLDQALRDSGRVVVHAVTGIGGVGKTSTAIEYAHRNARRFDIAWWIPAENPDLVPGRLAALAHALNLCDPATPSGDALAKLRVYLQTHGRWLLVFDNAENPDALRPLLPTGSGQIVITSRNPHWRGTATRIEITELPRADSIALMHELLPGISTHDADRVADAVGDLPLALDQAGSLLAIGGLTVETYLQLLTEQTENLLAFPSGLTYPRTAAAAWALAFDDLFVHHPASSDLLTLIARLAAEPVPLPLLFTATDSGSVDGLPDTLLAFATNPLALVTATDILTRRA